MERKYLKSNVSHLQYAEMIDYCNINNLVLENDGDYYYLLQPNEKIVDNDIVDNSAEYNREQERLSAKDEIEKLKRELRETDYKVRKCYEYSLVGKALPYDIEVIHNESEVRRNRINELSKLL